MPIQLDRKTSEELVCNKHSKWQSALLDAPWPWWNSLTASCLEGWPPHVKWHGDDPATSSRCLAFVPPLADATHGSFSSYRFASYKCMGIHGWVGPVKTPQSPPVTSCEDACNHGKSSVSSKLCIRTFKQTQCVFWRVFALKFCAEPLKNCTSQVVW